MAIELDPRFDGAHTDLARSLEALARFDEAREAYETGRRLAGGIAGPTFGLAHLEAAAGNTAEARRILAEFTAARGSRVVSAWGIAAVHASLGDVDEAFAWLETAITEKASGLMWLRMHPRLDPDPERPALLADGRAGGTGGRRRGVSHRWAVSLPDSHHNCPCDPRAPVSVPGRSVGYPIVLRLMVACGVAVFRRSRPAPSRRHHRCPQRAGWGPGTSSRSILVYDSTRVIAAPPQPSRPPVLVPRDRDSICRRSLPGAAAPERRLFTLGRDEPARFDHLRHGGSPR